MLRGRSSLNRRRDVYSGRRATFGLDLNWSRAGRRRWRGSALGYGSGALENRGPRSAASRGVDRKRQRSEHKESGGNGGGLGKNRGRAPGTESRLGTHAAEGAGEVGGFAALQEHDND